MWNKLKGKRAYRLLFSAALVLALAFVTFIVVPGTQVAHADGPTVTGLHVQGNQLVNGSGQTIRLLGVDHSGSEFACVQNSGIFDGQTDDTAIAAMAAWHINAVRVPLNEDCWLNINGINGSYAGTNYQQAIADYVNRLNNHGLAVILDLHWNAPGSQQSTGQEPMPDEDHTPAFWSSVASYFSGNSSVIFDLYNEPYPDSNQDTTAGWQCWRDGGSCPGASYQVAGMQQLVNVVRQAGASNVIMLGGLEYSNDLSQWLTYKPNDPDNNLAASWHSYNFNLCNNENCWNSQIAPVAQVVPVITGELGENDCADGYINSLMPWLDSHGISYLAWTWNTWDCSSGPALISDYTGTPTNFGVGFRDHLASLTGGGAGGGATGPIHAPGGKCVDVENGNPTDGTPVRLWDCNGASAQAWTVASNGTLQALGKCLDIIGDGTAPGSKLELWDCNGVGGQQWVPQANGSLLNPQSGNCLDDPAGNTADGTQLQIWTCNNLWPQVYQLPGRPLLGAIGAPGGKCVDVADGNAASGTSVQLWDCNGTNAQTWTVAPNGTLQALGKCLDIIGNGTAAGTKVQLWDCNGVGGQQWVPQANGSLLNPQSGNCLDDPAGNTADGTQLQIWTCNNQWPQVYQLP